MRHSAHITRNTYTDAQLERAQAIVDAHNAAVNPTAQPWCAEGRPGYLIIDLTGRKSSYFTLYRYNNLTLAGRDPYTYIKNLSTDLIQAVEKVATHAGLPIMLSGEDNFNPEHIPHTCFQHGKYRGQSIATVYETDPQYVVWAANNFTAKNKKQQIVKDTLSAIKEAHFQMLTERNQAECQSEYQGQLKERMTLSLTIYTGKKFSSEWGPAKTRYRAVDANGNLYQFYSKNHDIKPNTTVDITGTVMNHREYVGKRYTCLNRVNITIIDTPQQDEPEYDSPYDMTDYEQPYYSHSVQCHIDRLDRANEFERRGGCPIQAAEMRMGA